jgi:hypothetical protein
MVDKPEPRGRAVSIETFSFHRRSDYRIAAVAAASAVLIMGLVAVRPPVVRAAVSVNLDQFATLDKAWQNGNLNGNNSTFPEGGIVPFRLAIEGLKSGKHTIHINYDFTAGGHKAYDFLATWSGWVSPGACAKSGGGISEMCPNLPGKSSYSIPSDTFKTDGLTVSGAEDYSGVSRRLTIWGGTISSISKPHHSGSTGGNSTADISVTFTSNGSSVLLAWGGHLAQSAYWNRAAGGSADGAGQVSGAPWHMRTLNIDGAGAKNQDRSIQPSAISGELPPRALAPQPRPTPTPTPRPKAPAPKPPAQPPDPDDPAVPDDDPWWLKPPETDTATMTGAAGGTIAAIVVVFAAVATTTMAVRRRREGL